MTTLQYLDKRDDKGVILRYSAHELAFNVTSRAFDLISSNEIYSILVDNIPRKYVDIYYQQMIYEAFLPLAHQLVIYRHDKQNTGNVPVNAIDATSFPSPELLKKIWPQNEIYYSMSLSSQFKTYIKYGIKHLLIDNKRLMNSFYRSAFNAKSDGRTNKIAINYVEGFDPNKRSDIFWFENSGINPDSLLIYYESPLMMTRHDNNQTAQEFFTKQGIKQVKLWQWNTSNEKSIFDKLKHCLDSSKRSNNIDKWMYSSAVQLYKKISFWRSFFYHNNIRLHLDPVESGLEKIIKQIALLSIGGLSIGKMRSHPMSIDFWYFYPNDVFFSWGLETAKKIHSTNDHIENILVSGFPFVATKKKTDNETVEIETKLKSNNTRFNILLLDSNHGKNEGLSQFIETSRMVAFYRAFLDWVVEDKDIGVIIKPKKAHLFESLPGVINYIDEVEKNTDRCILIKNSFQKMPSTYLQGIDMVVGTGTFFSSAVVECVIHGARGVFYDYPNLRHHEKKLYEWGENRVIFSDIDVMISALKAYKNNPSTNPNLGDWSTNIDELDPFRDNKGGERIGVYMRWLLESFDKGISREDAIGNANKLFAESWGDDKIYYSGGV